MSMLIDSQSMSLALPAARCDLDLSVGEQGFINSVAFIGLIVSSHFWGFITDSWGRIKTLRIALLLSFVFSMISSVSLTSWMLSLSRFIVGLCTSGVRIAALTYLGEFHTDKNRPKYYTLLVSTITCGILVQTLLALVIMPLDLQLNVFSFFVFRSWRLFIMCGNVISGAALLGTLCLPEGPMYMFARGQHDESLEILRNIYSINTGQPKESYPVHRIVKLDNTASNISGTRTVKDFVLLLWNQTWPIFHPPYRSTMLVLCTFSYVMFSIGQAFEIWYPQILTFYTNHIESSITMCQAVELGLKTTVTNVSASSNAATAAAADVGCQIIINMVVYRLLIIVGIFHLVSSLSVGYLLGICNTKWMLTSWTSLTTIGCLGLLLTENFYMSTVSTIIFNSISPLINVVIPLGVELIPINYKGMAISLIFMFGRIGTVVGINILALMLINHCDMIFGLNCGVLSMSTIACYYIFRRSEQWKRKEISMSNHTVTSTM